jgi:hypothetical protein
LIVVCVIIITVEKTIRHFLPIPIPIRSIHQSFNPSIDRRYVH